MNQKQNILKINFNMHFEGSIELRDLIKWLTSLVIAAIRLAIHLYGGS